MPGRWAALITPRWYACSSAAACASTRLSATRSSMSLQYRRALRSQALSPRQVALALPSANSRMRCFSVWCNCRLFTSVLKAAPAAALPPAAPDTTASPPARPSPAASCASSASMPASCSAVCIWYCKSLSAGAARLAPPAPSAPCVPPASPPITTCPVARYTPPSSQRQGRGSCRSCSANAISLQNWHACAHLSSTKHR